MRIKSETKKLIINNTKYLMKDIAHYCLNFQSNLIKYKSKYDSFLHALRIICDKIRNNQYQLNQHLSSIKSLELEQYSTWLKDCERKGVWVSG